MRKTFVKKIGKGQYQLYPKPSNSEKIYIGLGHLYEDLDIKFVLSRQNWHYVLSKDDWRGMEGLDAIRLGAKSEYIITTGLAGCMDPFDLSIYNLKGYIHRKYVPIKKKCYISVLNHDDCFASAKKYNKKECRGLNYNYEVKLYKKEIQDKMTSEVSVRMMYVANIHDAKGWFFAKPIDFAKSYNKMLGNDNYNQVF